MEVLFEFLFGAGGRINRAEYWRSVLIYIGLGMMTAVILFTAAGLAAPLVIVAIIFVALPLLLWGLAFTTKRLHDRDKSAWWLVVFYVMPSLLTQPAKLGWPAGITGTVLQTIMALAALALLIWGHVEIGFLRGTAGSNTYGPDPLLQPKRRN